MAERLRNEYVRRAAVESNTGGNRVPALQKKFGVSAIILLLFPILPWKLR